MSVLKTEESGLIKFMCDELTVTCKILRKLRIDWEIGENPGLRATVLPIIGGGGVVCQEYFVFTLAWYGDV